MFSLTSCKQAVLGWASCHATEVGNPVMGQVNRVSRYVQQDTRGSRDTRVYCNSLFTLMYSC